MASPDVYSGCARRYQRARDAEIFLRAEQTVGIERTEREPEQRRDRRKRDVTLAPVEPEAEHALALPFTVTHDSVIGHRAGVGTGRARGECEARHLVAARAPGQVVTLLLLAAVVLQQLTATG